MPGDADDDCDQTPGAQHPGRLPASVEQADHHRLADEHRERDNDRHEQLADRTPAATTTEHQTQ
jgi:hypothetical protein